MIKDWYPFADSKQKAAKPVINPGLAVFLFVTLLYLCCPKQDDTNTSSIHNHNWYKPICRLRNWVCAANLYLYATDLQDFDDFYKVLPPQEKLNPHALYPVSLLHMTPLSQFPLQCS